ncbi:hypothetical protein DPMN_175635 [Dreissena polymorpha]|uniref:Uncharacterized protein n=1 Tax=Dreissena polymorpha TaxID=45954 RepID=A0A9D4IIF6_DREPO|nr:hypothetical protein DPMN_175635 [Dreissena polymorpha]
MFLERNSRTVEDMIRSLDNNMAAADKGLKANAASKCNFVAQDQIWKDHVKLEETASRFWPNKWKFMTTKYEDLVKDEIPKKEKRHKDVEPIEPHPVTPIEKYIKVDPSPKPYPRTTAQNIGWRSTEAALALDRGFV